MRSTELPASVDLVAARGGGNLDAGESRSVVNIVWEGGGQSLLPTAEFVRRARAAGSATPSVMPQ